jgi:large subunit ribosomal protein L9
MKIILLKDVPKVGKKYDVKDISDGYAANLLIPRGLAVAATASAMKTLEIDKSKMDGEKKIHVDLIMKNLNDLEKTTITVVGKANEKGHLFAGLHKEDIAKEIEKQTRLQIDSSFIQLEHPIKEVGEHSIEVNGAGKSVKFILKIEAGK